MISRRALLCLVLMCQGCVKPAPAIPDEPAPAPAPTDDPQPEPEPELGARFWVVNGGLRAHDLDGEPVADLGDFGDWAIRLADGRVVVVREVDERAQLAVLNPDGQRSAALELPTVFEPESCSPRVLRPGELEELEAPILAMQSDRDFHVSRGGFFACLTLLDRNENMADYEINVAVELATGKVAAALVFDIHEQCPAAEEHPACASWEGTHSWIEAPDPDFDNSNSKKWPLRYEQGFVVDEVDARVADLCPPGVRDDPEFDFDWGPCPGVELESSSKRWLLLGGNVSEGDYIHREPVILDRASGELWQIFVLDEDGAGYRFVPVEADTLFAERPDVPGHTLDLVGESEVEVLPEDRFWIDGLLLIPERREIVEIGGQLAQIVSE